MRVSTMIRNAWKQGFAWGLVTGLSVAVFMLMLLAERIGQ